MDTLVHNDDPHLPVTGGDDAYFVNAGNSGALDLGVFDGVGGWARRGHDPGVFTRGFAKAAAGNLWTMIWEKIEFRPLFCKLSPASQL